MGLVPAGSSTRSWNESGWGVCLATVHRCKRPLSSACPRLRAALSAHSWHLCVQADWTHCHVLSVAWLLGSWHQQVVTYTTEQHTPHFTMPGREWIQPYLSNTKNVLTHRSKPPLFRGVNSKLYTTRQGIPVCHYIHHPSGIHNNLVTIQPLLKQEKNTQHG